METCGPASLAHITLNNKIFCLVKDGREKQQIKLFSGSTWMQWYMSTILTHTNMHTYGWGEIEMKEEGEMYFKNNIKDICWLCACVVSGQGGKEAR